MLNVSTLVGTRESRSDALRYGLARDGAATPSSSTARRPVVVWNVTRACNLACAHCYASARLRPAGRELDNKEARVFLDDLAAFGVPAVLISGGEPLCRPDLLELVAHGRSHGLAFTLSTNGTLIDTSIARSLAEAGAVYVGVSVDGDERTHDRLRRAPGAYRRAVSGLDHLGAAGIRRGVRFTLGQSTQRGLEAVLALVAGEGIERFCFYHLVPAGRGGRLDDVSAFTRRAALERVFRFALEHPEVEVLTVDNPSDGPVLCRWLEERDREAAARCRRLLAWNAGARGGPGVGLAAVDERGDVHPDQFSRHRTVGNVRARPFSEIWSRPTDPYLRRLRSGDRPLPETCRACPELSLCGGGLRSRAELATGDPWGFDPACTLAGTVIPGRAP